MKPRWSLLVLLSVSAAYAQGMTTTGKVRHARNLPELIASFEFTLNGILTEDEKANLTFRDPQRVREVDPELYEKVSQNIRHWTEDWIGYATSKLDTVPEERVQDARRTAERIDALMKAYFAERGWPYRSIRVVFIPQRLFFDERDRGSKLLGTYIPFYPDVLFSTIDPFAPLEYILVHETLHYNATSGRYGRAFVEGVTDSGARYLVARFELLTPAKLRATETYTRERGMVDVLSGRLREVTGQTEEQALEAVLEAYLTDDASRVTAAFGEQAWDRIVDLSRTSKWRKREILACLAAGDEP